jgi:hypothetical protein
MLNYPQKYYSKWIFNRYGFNGIFTSPIHSWGFKLQFYILCSSRALWASACMKSSLCLNGTFCFYRKQLPLTSVLLQASRCILSC